MSASSPSSDPGVDKRRTTRVVHAIPIVVRGMDALGQAFKESTTTVMVNCNGCKCRSKHYVPKDSRVTVEIGPTRAGAMPRIVPARVVWVQRPRTFRDIFHVAMEFEVPGNVWEIQSPPEDWFPHPDDEHLEVPLTEEAALNGQSPSSDPAALYIPPAVNLEAAAARAIQTFSGSAATDAAGADKGLTLVMPAPQMEIDPELAAARQMVTAAVQAAMANEATKLHLRLAAQLQESVKETVKLLAQSVADTVMKEFVERAAERTAALVVEARQASLANAEQLDAKIRIVLQEVVRKQRVPRKAAAPGNGKRKPRKGSRETVAT